MRHKTKIAKFSIGSGIAIVLVLSVLGWVLGFRACVKIGTHIDQHGLKSVIEKVWKGKDNKP